MWRFEVLLVCIGVLSDFYMGITGMWLPAGRLWESDVRGAWLYSHQDAAELRSLLSFSSTYTKRRWTLAKIASANWAGNSWEVRLARGLSEVQEVVICVVHLLLHLPSAKANFLLQMVLCSLCGDWKMVAALCRVGRGNFWFNL